MTYDPLECLFKAHVRNIHSDRPGHFTDEIAAVHVLRTGNHEDILMARGEVADGGCLTRPGRSEPHRTETGIDARCRIKTTETITFNTIQIMASIFSRIIAGEIPSYKVAEDDRYYAFLDINPLTKGHTLVVPKQEVDYLFDLDDETLAGMMVFAKKVAARIKREIDCARVAVVVLGMEVPHAHIHLIPIKDENDVDFHREKLQLTPEEFREIADKLAR